MRKRRGREKRREETRREEKRREETRRRNDEKDNYFPKKREKPNVSPSAKFERFAKR